METVRTDRKRRSIWPILLFAIAVGAADFVLLRILFRNTSWMMGFSRWFEAGISSSIYGQLLFAVLVGGLTGRVWLKGIAIGSLMLAYWIACLDTQIIERIDVVWYVYAIPACIFGGAIPLLLCRFVFGWRLSSESNTSLTRGNFGIEDIFLFTTAIASILFLCRIPNIATEVPSANVLLPLAGLIGEGAAGSLFILIPVVYLCFRVKNWPLRWLGYIGLMSSAYLVILIFEWITVPMGLLSVACPMILGVDPVLLVGLTAMRLSGIELTHYVPKAVTGSIEVVERNQIADRIPRRLWAFGFLAFAAFSSFSLAVFDQWNYQLDVANLELQQSMQKNGSAIEVLGRTVIELTFGPETTDQTLNDFRTIETIKTISLANSQVTDACLPFLLKFPQLQSLDLSRTRISNEGLFELQKLLQQKQLNHLSVAYTKVTLPELSNIKGLLNCKSLDLSGLGITDDQCDFLFALLGYERSLFLRDNQLTDNKLKELFSRGDGFCGTLDLSGNPIDGSCLSELQNVQTLILEEIPLTDAGMAAVLSPGGLFKAPTGRIVLSRTKLTETSLGSLGPRIELGDGISESSLAKCGISNLNRLKLKGESFNGSCFESWHPTIYELDLEGCAVTDETVKFLSNVKMLQSLNLENTQVTDKSLLHLADIPYVKLGHTRISFEGLRDAFLPDKEGIQIALGQFSVKQVRELKRKLPIVVGKTNWQTW